MCLLAICIFSSMNCLLVQELSVSDWWESFAQIFA